MAEGSPPPRKIVLIVDDDPAIRSMMSQILELEGFPTVVAANGREALERLRVRADATGLILLDLMMPVMNGWEFRHEQTRDPRLAQIPVIILSGDGQVHRRKESLGADGFLLKPVDLQVLLRLVRRYCS